jgi:phage-related protein
MNTVGQNVKEIRIRDEAGAFRVLYVAKFADAIYVLHGFQKKTEKTTQSGCGACRQALPRVVEGANITSLSIGCD